MTLGQYLDRSTDRTAELARLASESGVSLWTLYAVARGKARIATVRRATAVSRATKGLVTVASLSAPVSRKQAKRG